MVLSHANSMTRDAAVASTFASRYVREQLPRWVTTGDGHDSAFVFACAGVRC
jgi:hypothetical protein